jgi:orotidine-5'-phosphate decarboxylase
MDQLLIALDVGSAADARVLAKELRGIAGGFKIGSQLFTAHGPSIVDELVSHGDRVFLDLKFHDIPNTVARASAAATKLGVWMFNVHAAGGSAMLRAARAAVDEEAARMSRPAPLVIGVTMLTSMSDETLREVGVVAPIAVQVERLAALARSAGLDGVVASPLELPIIRSTFGARWTVVTPGIRGSADEKGDQTRTMTAAQALSAGASFIVVGRPVIAAADPRAAAERIAAECRAAQVM